MMLQEKRPTDICTEEYSTFLTEFNGSTRIEVYSYIANPTSDVTQLSILYIKGTTDGVLKPGLQMKGETSLLKSFDETLISLPR